MQNRNERPPVLNASLPPLVAMLQMIAGFWVSRAIYIAAKLGIADRVAEASETHRPFTECCARSLAWASSPKKTRSLCIDALAATLQSGVPG